MSPYLLSISIGPVQGFIAAARKTRDLWFGSHMLSEISKAVAQFLYMHPGAELIFPGIDNPSELNKGSGRDVSNKLLVRIPEMGEKDIETLVNDARAKAQERWEEFTTTPPLKLSPFLNMDFWNKQVKDAIEFYAAWVPMQDDYAASWRHVERALGGRKMLRDFLPYDISARVPKSSLDGARDTVFLDPFRLTEKVRSCAHLKGAEQLDAVGLTKRLSGDPDQQFVSVPRVAADPWVRFVQKDSAAKTRLDEIAAQCHPDFACKITDPVYAEFAREGEVLFPNRVQSLIDDKDLEKHKLPLKTIQETLGKIASRKNGGLGLDVPSPYFAVLLADGDRMGNIISLFKDKDAHKRFSSYVSQFAREAKKIIKTNHGCPVYIGADDILAFLPLDTCLAAARSLREKFDELVRDKLIADGFVAAQPSLSVGIAIGHCLEHLDYLLDLGRAAEKDAKNGRRPDRSDDRDGLAVHFRPRGGSRTYRARKQWAENPDRQILEWMRLIHECRVSSKAAYDLFELSRTYEGWPDQTWAHDVLRADILRMLKKKRGGEESFDPKIVEGLLQGIKTGEDLARASELLVIAQQMLSCIPEGARDDFFQRRIP